MGEVEIIASLVHSGRTTQLWDAEITSLSSGRRMALFRATQIILYPT
jgi:acyl-coenzyme A thioesterase PaaI-like protein